MSVGFQTGKLLARGNELLQIETAELSVAKLKRVPDKYREFSCDVDNAARRYSVKGPLLEFLLDLGLPHIGRGDHLLFDSNDLSNVSLDLELPTGHRHSMRLWSRSLYFARKVGKVSYEFTVKAGCPQPGHTGLCDYKFDSRIEEKVKISESPGGIFRFRGHPVDDFFDFGDLIAPLVSEAQRLQFHVLPLELASDMGFLNETGLANCQSATLWLMQVAARHGILIRPAMGLFVSVPYSVRHLWLQISAENEWKHADPFFLNALVRWGVVERGDWPLTQSPRYAVLHLSSELFLRAPLLWHGNEPAPWGTTIMTALVASTLPSTLA
jgi:hypothetical protein